MEIPGKYIVVGAISMGAGSRWSYLNDEQDVASWSQGGEEDVTEEGIVYVERQPNEKAQCVLEEVSNHVQSMQNSNTANFTLVGILLETDAVQGTQSPAHSLDLV